MGHYGYTGSDEMRYYLDTNILAFNMYEGHPDISRDVEKQISDYSSLLYTSTVCVHELVHLVQIGKIGNSRRAPLAEAKQIMPWLHTIGVTIMPVNEIHLQTMSELPFLSDHRDPNDRLIIAQAIADRITLVSSDHRFKLYEPYGLRLLFNKR